MSETITINQITLISRETTLHFLSTRPDPDEVIRWTCPNCNAVNDHTFHHCAAICAVCGEGRFPAIPLPIVGDAKTSVRRAFQNDRLSQIDDDIKEARERINGCENEIAEQARYITHLEKERDDLNHALHLDVTHGACLGEVD